MGYINPLLRLPAAQRIMALPQDQREPLEALLRELSADADREAENAWKRRKGPMAAYWRAVSTYARHTAHMLSVGQKRARIVEVRHCAHNWESGNREESWMLGCTKCGANYEDVLEAER